jgi:hypothetical protein
MLLREGIGDSMLQREGLLSSMHHIQDGCACCAEVIQAIEHLKAGRQQQEQQVSTGVQGRGTWVSYSALAGDCWLYVQ